VRGWRHGFRHRDRGPGAVASTDVINSDLALALQLADDADAITTARFRARDLAVETKPDLTPVTEADRAVERTLRDRVARDRPDDALLGEEYGEAATGGAGAHRKWIVDPIDGTKGYVRGLPVWATLIALVEDGRVSVGVVSAPALGRRWWAVRGGGAFVDGEPIHVSAVARLEDAHLSYDSYTEFRMSGLGDAFLALERRCWRARGFGDFWSYVLVAEGAVDVAIEPVGLSPWDLAAVMVVVEEAGGRFTDLDGVARFDGGSAVATNGLLHDDVLRSLTGRGA
jgi:histidinol-phosphatase